MIRFIRKHKKIIVDFFYSVVAYALPTIILQFLVQPMIASQTSADENGLFVTLFNAVKLTTGIFILPLANLRLLKKQECDTEKSVNSFFNLLFGAAIILTALVGSILNVAYRQPAVDFGAIARLLVFLILMGIHDYYSISFRLVLSYKKIVVDNLLIVLGYGLGLFLFRHFGNWEIIFICGYLFGTVYVLLNSKIWRSLPKRKSGTGLVRQYSELSASSVLSNTSTYCDRLIIYPVLGGYAVSVYNAAAIVSKAVSVISAPLRNVLLSYIVNRNSFTISKARIRKFIPLTLLGILGVFLVFWGFSIVACNLLYPQYVASAKPYIPVIILAVILETVAGIMNIALLRFAKTRMQTIISGLKLGVYLVFVVILSVVFKLGLWGFCFAILVAAAVHVLAVVYGLKKNITITD